MVRPKTKVSKVLMVGPLVSFTDGLSSMLTAAGYTPLSIVNQLRLLAHVSRWMDGHDYAVTDLTGEVLEEYLALSVSMGCRYFDARAASAFGSVGGGRWHRVRSVHSEWRAVLAGAYGQEQRGDGPPPTHRRRGGLGLPPAYRPQLAGRQRGHAGSCQLGVTRGEQKRPLWSTCSRWPPVSTRLAIRYRVRR